MTAGSNLLMLTSAGSYNWIEGDTATSVQGAVYGYGDGTSCTVSDSVSVCTTQSNCCISGATIVDSTYAAYGCGIGVSLNDAGGTATKAAYAGTAVGFRVTITGSFTQELRVGYTSSADTSGQISPFKGGSAQASTITAPGTYTILFTDVSCPPAAWGTCNPLAGGPFDFQAQIVGAAVAGAYELCITELSAVTG